MLHETQEDLENEEVVRKLLEKNFNCNVVKLKRDYRADFALFHEKVNGFLNHIWAFAEFKCRDQNYGKYDTVALSLMKFHIIRAYCDRFNVQFYFFIRFNNGYWFVNLSKFDPDDIYLIGRTDRNDPNDIEPCIRIPIKEFIFFHPWGK